MDFQPPAFALTAVVLALICCSADCQTDKPQMGDKAKPEGETEMTEVKLVGSDGRCSGTPMIFFKGKWRRVNSLGFDYRSAMVVCRELSCGSAVKVTFRRDLRKLSKEETSTLSFCTGNELLISQCGQYIVSNLTSLTPAVICSDSVRLVDGAGLCSGRVEVKLNQSWTMVCEADFDWQDAEVVCRELGCGPPLILQQKTLFGEGKHPFGSDELQCNGTEKSLHSCRTSTREKQGCTGAGSAVGLTCSEPDDVRLVDGSSRCDGIVEVFYSGVWRRVMGYSWSRTQAAVVCRQLGCSSAGTATWRESRRSTTEHRIRIFCRGSESALRECSFYINEVFVYEAGVICLDVLEQPTLSSSTPKRMSRGHLQVSEVFKGLSFTITCRIKPQFSGGSFLLKPPYTNTSHTQTADNHSASFFFPAADDSHQGNYSCIYKFQGTFLTYYQVFIQNFSAESESLFLTVTDSPLPVVITRMLLVPFLLLISCLLIFLILKKFGHIFIRNTSGQQGAADAVQYGENIELVSLEHNIGRRSGQELPTDLEQEEEEEEEASN